MLVCEQEEPLQVNGQLDALDEETGVVGLSYIEDPRLNRYSFIWLGERSETYDAFTRLIQALLEHSHTPATWVLAWERFWNCQGALAACQTQKGRLGNLHRYDTCPGHQASRSRR